MTDTKEIQLLRNVKIHSFLVFCRLPKMINVRIFNLLGKQIKTTVTSLGHFHLFGAYLRKILGANFDILAFKKLV